MYDADPDDFGDQPDVSPAEARVATLVEGLTPEQRAAVEHRGKPLVILAGAGTGKTSALTRRIAHLIASGDAHPEEILAVTFTNKAARELEKRIKVLLDDDLKGMEVGTFHSICARMLRNHHTAFGVPQDFTIMDSDDQKRMIKRIAKLRWGKNVEKEMIDDALDFIHKVRLDPAEVSGLMNRADEDVRYIYHEYERMKKEDGVLDFDDLIAIVHNAFENGVVDPRQLSEKWRHVLVDEYQDTNGLQFEWLRMVIGDNPNLAVVGDDDQVLYTWRGAKIENILRFHEKFDDTSIIRLERNFRSTGHILDAANGLIGHNKNRLGKTLYTTDGKGWPVNVRYFLNAELEAKWVFDEIKALIDAGTPAEDIAILSRASHAMNLIEQKMTWGGIPYVLSGGRKFQDKAEIRDAMAYMRLACNTDDTASFDRIVNQPKRGVGDISVKRILDATDAARKAGTGMTLLQVIDTFARSKAFPGDVPANLLQFAKVMTEANRRFWRNATAAELLTYLLDATGYRQELQRAYDEARSVNDNDAAEKAEIRLSNLTDLEKLGVDMGPIELIEHLGLAEDGRAKNAKGVWVGTIHAAKGLEWPVVIGIGWEDNLFPSWQALSERGEALAEERRCGYVQITRARERMTITHTGERFMKPAVPSRFLTDLPRASCQFMDMQPDDDEDKT